MDARESIIVALDTKAVPKALELVTLLRDHVGGFKVGLEFFTSTYALLMALPPNVIGNVLRELQELYAALSGSLFWDGKWNDIPNTCLNTALGLQPLKAKYLNIHASSGKNAIQDTVANKGGAKVLAVTVLTSLDAEEVKLIFGDEPNVVVLRLARIAKSAGADGVICSPKELELLSGDSELATLIKVTPGVRPLWAAAGDQKRIMTPKEAKDAGASAMVIGRPITSPPKEIGTPLDAVKRILDEIA